MQKCRPYYCEFMTSLYQNRKKQVESTTDRNDKPEALKVNETKIMQREILIPWPKLRYKLIEVFTNNLFQFPNKINMAIYIKTLYKYA